MNFKAITFTSMRIMRRPSGVTDVNVTRGDDADDDEARKHEGMHEAGGARENGRGGCRGGGG